VTRIALFSACASLALLSACTDATTGSSSGTSAGTLGGLTTPAAPPTPAAINTNLVTPAVQQTFNTFSANQRLSANGYVGGDVLATQGAGLITVNVGGLPAVTVVTSTPIDKFQVPTGFSYGIPGSANTIKQDVPNRLGDGSVLIGASGNPTTSSAIVIGAVYEGSQPVDSSSEVTIDFNPRDAVYLIKAKTASIDTTIRWQDPQHRTVFQQTLVPGSMTLSPAPALANYKYAEAATGVSVDTGNLNTRSSKRDISTLFVRDTGTTGILTQYVTIAGFVQQKYTETEVVRSSDTTFKVVGVDFTTDIARSVFVYGINTPYKDIPKSGAASYSGDMYAHVIETPQNHGTDNDMRSIVGTSSATVDFGTGKLTLALAGNVVGFAGDTRAFAARGAMDIFRPDTRKEGDPSRFTGAISSWSFGAYNSTAVGGIVVPTAASTVEGGFFGPKDQEIGGAFRIIGNRPDERLDILGAFTGKKGN
jgi:hypothetical protein